MFESYRSIVDAIAHIPNLLSITRLEKFESVPRLVVHTQPEVAERIAAVLPDRLRERGWCLVQLPRLDPGEGCSVRIPVSNRPWVDAEIRVMVERGQLVVLGVPERLPIGDAAAVAGALLAIDDAAQRMRRRGCRPSPTSDRRREGQI